MHLSTYLIVFCASLAVGILLVSTKKWHGHFSMDHTHGVQKFHTVPTPRIGGLAIFAGVFAGWLIASESERVLLTPLLIAGLPAFVFGLLEDVTKQVGVTARLLATMVSGAVACWLTGITISSVDIPVLDDLLKYWPLAMIFTAFAVGGIANSVNIIDGFNGLSSGAVIIILAALGFIAINHGDVTLARIFFLLIAAVAGFFLLNFPYGKLFLGDGGAYFVGFALSWLAVLLAHRNPSMSPWVLLLATAYPIIEVLYSMVRRMHYKQPTGAPDSLHLHSLIKTQLIKPSVGHWPPVLRNAAVSPLLWLFAALPAGLAVALSGQKTWILGVVFLGCVLVYHLLYRVLERKLNR